MIQQPITCIIVDDEPPAIRLLQKYVEQLPGLECIGTATRAVEALHLIEQQLPDIVFLDIQMPDLTGLQLSALIKGKVKVVFTTAYPQFAVEGFEQDAVDYLLKPVAFNRFIGAVEKVRKISDSSKPKSVAETVQEDYFFIKTDGKNRYKRVLINEIYYIESIKNYVVIHTGDEQVITYNTLKYFEEHLPEDRFVKIHKSYMVALGKIEKTDTNEVWILNKSLPLGDTYKSDFFKRVQQFLL
ncbi:LytTR family DNA-binding domain-containing protein [Flavobacterium sp. CAU 1735]|uniref:LytR/AlgR family response regulator transcription factor n=1 Tax=Flavobacterium sp. CAU 1735 TaxID=3140361 RepID=UPI003261C6DE